MKSSYNGAHTAGRRNTGPSSMRPSTSVGHLSSFGDGNGHGPLEDDGDDDGSGGLGAHGKKIKRTKSMWKFKKTGDEVLTGMSMWKHRSLVDVNAADADEGLGTNSYNNKSSAGTPVANKKFTITCRDIDIAGTGGAGGGGSFDDDDNQTIMNGGGGGSSTIRRMTYDNRKERTSAGSGRKSSSSSFGGDDSESCIVVDDHLQRDPRTTVTGPPGSRAAQQPPPAANLLPRTRLIKQTAGNGFGGGSSRDVLPHQQTAAVGGSPTLFLPPPPPPAVRTATASDGYAQRRDSEADVRFESSKLQTFKYMNAANNDGWYDSWGEKRKK